uniref:Reticulon-like protein n=1 Tax=Ditylenchus dipsaci TaxID=166011 RepID=A0A915CY48_9BILA
MAAKKILFSRQNINSHHVGNEFANIDMSSCSQNISSATPQLAYINHHQQFVVSPSPVLKRETVDTKLLDLLRKNYDIISVIADIERGCDSPTSPSSLVSDKCCIMQHESTPPTNTLSPRRSSQQTIMSSCSTSHLTTTTTVMGSSSPRRRASLAVPLLQLGNGDVGSPVLVEEAASDTSSNSIAEEMAVEAMDSDRDMPCQSTCTWTSRLNGGLSRLYNNVLDALSETNDDLKAQNRPAEAPPKLSAYALRRDIRRCLLESHSYVETLAGLKELFIWSNPIATLSIFSVYMYSVFRGWVVTLTLFLILLQLGFNYLSSQKRINLGLQFLPRKELQQWKLDLSGAQLVFDVARRTQVMLTFAADCLEKFKYLFSWKKPEVTLNFLFIVLTFFLLSVVLTTGWWFTVVGFLIGGKSFFTTYMYHRFPRLRSLFDVLFYFYSHLPTSRSAVLQATPSKSNLTSFFGQNHSSNSSSKWTKPDSYS